MSKIVEDTRHDLTLEQGRRIASLDTFTPSATGNHHADHENGGSDEISVAGLSGQLADAQVPAAHPINSSTYHSTGGATSGKMLKADANGLPAEATNTDAEVADAVTKKHVAATVNAPLVITTQDIELQNNATPTPARVTTIDIDGTLAGNSDVKIPTQKAVKTYTDGKVEDSIADGHTTIAPSGNAVFDALALKAVDADVIKKNGSVAMTAAFQNGGFKQDNVGAPVDAHDGMRLGDDFIKGRIVGSGGFVETVSAGPIWMVALSDTDAQVRASFHVKVGGVFKLMMVWSESEADPANPAISGIYGYAVFEGTNLHEHWDVDGPDWDLQGNDQNHLYFTTLNVNITVTPNSSDGAHVGVFWQKNDNGGGGTGYIYIYGMYLVRQ